MKAGKQHPYRPKPNHFASTFYPPHFTLNITLKIRKFISVSSFHKTFFQTSSGSFRYDLAILFLQ